MMCSATHAGFRRRRSKEEISAWRVARSATGPGKPYWKRPAGSTGDMISLAGSATGTGVRAEVVDVVEMAVEEAIAAAAACAFFSDRVEYIAAVIPAPVAALAAAMRARVVLDIVGKMSRRARGRREIFIWARRNQPRGNMFRDIGRVLDAREGILVKGLGLSRGANDQQQPSCHMTLQRLADKVLITLSWVLGITYCPIYKENVRLVNRERPKTESKHASFPTI